MKATKLDFSNQEIFVGLDVHKKSWTVTIMSNNLRLKNFNMEPRPQLLVQYLRREYPGAKYISVYEAGFCGYWIDRELRAANIENKIVNPADVPTTNKEKSNKTDKNDSKKLTRELSNGSLEGIYVPDKESEALRALSRLRMQLTKDQTRQKNRIKSLLNFVGIEIPENSEMQHWSKRFIDHLLTMEIEQEAIKLTLEISLNNLKQTRKEISEVVKSLRKMVKQNPKATETISHLMSIPGIGFIIAITLYTEIIDIKRFRKFDNLCSFVGLAPAVHSSGEREIVLGITNRHSRYLRNLLIEAAWIAARKDPALTMVFGKLIKRMSKQKAIIRISKKLLNRINCIWRKNQDYAYAVV